MVYGGPRGSISRFDGWDSEFLLRLIDALRHAIHVPSSDAEFQLRFVHLKRGTIVCYLIVLRPERRPITMAALHLMTAQAQFVPLQWNFSQTVGLRRYKGSVCCQHLPGSVLRSFNLLSRTYGLILGQSSEAFADSLPPRFENETT